MKKDMDWCQVFRTKGGWLAEVCVHPRAIKAKGRTREEAMAALAEKMGQTAREAA